MAVTVIGPAGIGKSRLVRELLDDIGDDATIAIGRCLSYGEDVAYRPLAEIVRQVGGEQPAAGIAALLDGDEALTRSVLRAVGLGDDAPVQADETFWAVRRLLERAAARRPLVLAVDDVHWAEPTLLDLLDYVGAFSERAPDPRPVPRAARVRRDAPRVVRAGIGSRPSSPWSRWGRTRRTSSCATCPAPPGSCERAEGNPLFLEQLVAMGADEGALPSSIQAVLAARIERLDPDERDVLERASVEGVRFHVGGLARREPPRARSRARASSAPIARRPDAFRFEHALIRDAAYLGVPKERRADLHEEAAAGVAAEDETVGHHLARGCRLLARAGARRPTRARAGGGGVRAAGGRGRGRAATRGRPAGARLLERAAALAPRRPASCSRASAPRCSRPAGSPRPTTR